MMDTFTFDAGTAPLLVSVPHDGRQLPCEIAGEMTAAGRSIPDTDWHVARLYDFARDLGASFIRAEYSRYVIDERIGSFWHPYHEKIDAALQDIRSTHGYALLWDAHSISSHVPRLFDGELPELNLGTWGNRSCDVGVSDAVMTVATTSSFGVVQNGRFKGGHITRHYGQPGGDVHAIQLELSQRTYMDEASLEYDDTKASRLRDTLEQMLTAFMRAADK